jgi:hypothetical protein
MVSMPRVWMIDDTGATRGLIRYRKVTWVPRYNDIGTWHVECQLTPKTVLAAQAGWRIIIVDDSGLSGGHVNEAEVTLQGRTRNLVLSGYDDMFWLKYSLAWPQPAAAVGSQSIAYDVRTGAASTVLMGYLAANRGPTATDSTRRIPGLTIAADPLLGDTVTGRARFDEMLTMFQQIAITGNVGFRMLPSIGGTFSFDVYAPPDLAGPGRFGLALGNVRSVKWRLTAPTATYVVGGGRGEETARDFVSATDLLEDGGWGRREAFFDYRSASDTDSNAELLQGTQRRLDEGGSTQLIEIEPKDTDRLRYGRDYQLGSQVQVDVYQGIGMTAIIREVEITAARGGSGPVRTVTPRVGDLGATASSRMAVQVRDALARIANLETRR